MTPFDILWAGIRNLTKETKVRLYEPLFSLYCIVRNVGGIKLWRISKISHWRKNFGELPTWKIKQKFRPPDASGGPTVKLWQISTNRGANIELPL